MALHSQNKHYEMFGIQRHHFNSTAQKVGYVLPSQSLRTSSRTRLP
jgi:serine/threonine-protein kinase HipA